ncbi:hypothetical protein Trydic_g17905 [Trypoxylus dichotomus]
MLELSAKRYFLRCLMLDHNPMTTITTHELALEGYSITTVLLEYDRAYKNLVWGYISTSCAIVKVTYIPKLGRQKLKPDSYRSLGPMSFLLKILDTRGGFRLSSLYLDQRVYQMAKSIELTPHSLFGEDDRFLENKEIAVGAFLDAEGAFNNAQTRSLSTLERECPYKEVPSPCYGCFR